MPELPEVETVKRGLAPVMEGAIIQKLELRRDGLRFLFPENFSKRVNGATVLGLSRRAKYVLVELSTNETLIMHLGMSGSFRIEANGDHGFEGVFHHDRSKKPAHDHVIFHLETKTGTARIVYNDPRRFGFMDLIPTAHLYEHKFFAALGIEPTGNSLNGESLAKLLDGKSAPLKAALLDQRLIAGLGNIYVCEALWHAGLSPKRKANTIVAKGGKSTKRAERLSQAITMVIANAIKAGGSSLRDHRQADGSLGYFQHSFRTYDRAKEACLRKQTDGVNCDGVITRITQSGRSTFYCPKCQK